MDDLPIEIKEMIIFYCDGETLYCLSKLNQLWKTLVDQEDKRRNLFKRCLKSDINKEILHDLITKMYPKRTYLYLNPHLFKIVYCASLQWKYLYNKNRFQMKKISQKFLDITDLKISGSSVMVGDKRGLYVIDSSDGSLIFHDLGPVKNIELYCTSKKVKNPNYGYDKADIMTENNIHHFYDMWEETLEKPKKYHEGKIIKYYKEKSFEMNRSDYITGDFHENDMMMVTQNHVIRAKHSNPLNKQVTPFDFRGARAWFLWHSKLVICSKDDCLCIFADGKTGVIEYHNFPPITAIYYYAEWLFLGDRYGFLYGYSVPMSGIAFLDLNKFQMKTKAFGTAIVKINVIQEDSLPRIVVASNREISLLYFTKELRVLGK